MQKYEVTYFTAPEEKTSTVEDAIKELGGTLVDTKDLGTRDLAYKVGHLSEGQYTAIIFEIDGGKLADLENKIKQSKQIVRFVLVKALREKKVRERRAKTKIVKEKPAKSAETAELKETLSVPEPIKIEKPQKAEVAKPAVKPKPKISPKAKAKKTAKPKKTERPKKKDKELETTSSAELDQKLQELVED